MDKFWSILFAIIIVLCVALFAVAPAAGWWLPPNVATFGGSVDGLFYLILWITAFFFVLTEGILVYNMWKFASGPNRRVPYVHGNHRLEVMWTIVPAAILILIGVLQIGTWEDIKYHRAMPKPDKNTQQIEVFARQWEWRLRYPSPEQIEKWDKGEGKPELFRDAADVDDVHGVNEMHVYQNAKVLIHLRTRDVIHSFFIPVMRLKQDALPGKVIPVWFESTDYNFERDPKTGGWSPRKDKDGKEIIWDIACAEFCGTRHSMMKGRLYVHKDKADFLAWLRHAQQEDHQKTVRETIPAPKPNN